MSTIAIDATNPSTSINLAVLLKLIDKILDKAKINQFILAPDEYILLNEIRFAVATGVGSAETVTAVTMTY